MKVRQIAKRLRRAQELRALAENNPSKRRWYLNYAQAHELKAAQLLVEGLTSKTPEEELSASARWQRRRRAGKEGPGKGYTYDENGNIISIHEYLCRRGERIPNVYPAGQKRKSKKTEK